MTEEQIQQVILVKYERLMKSPGISTALQSLNVIQDIVRECGWDNLLKKMQQLAKDEFPNY